MSFLPCAEGEKSIMTTAAAQLTSEGTKALSLPTPGAGSHSLQLYPSHMALWGPTCGGYPGGVVMAW